MKTYNLIELSRAYGRGMLSTRQYRHLRTCLLDEICGEKAHSLIYAPMEELISKAPQLVSTAGDAAGDQPLVQPTHENIAPGDEVSEQWLHAPVDMPGSPRASVGQTGRMWDFIDDITSSKLFLSAVVLLVLVAVFVVISPSKEETAVIQPSEVYQGSDLANKGAPTAQGQLVSITTFQVPPRPRQTDNKLQTDQEGTYKLFPNSKLYVHQKYE